MPFFRLTQIIFDLLLRGDVTRDCLELDNLIIDDYQLHILTYPNFSTTIRRGRKFKISYGDLLFHLFSIKVQRGRSIIRMNQVEKVEPDQFCRGPFHDSFCDRIYKRKIAGGTDAINYVR